MRPTILKRRGQVVLPQFFPRIDTSTHRRGVSPFQTRTASLHHPDHLVPEVVLPEDEPLRLKDRLAALLVLPVRDRLPHDLHRLCRIVNRNRYEALLREDFPNRRIAGIERQALAEDRVRELLRPMMDADVVLDRNVIAIGNERILFPLQGLTPRPNQSISGTAFASSSTSRNRS